MSKIKNATNGVFAGIINNMLGIVLPFISRTILINQLGIEYVGLGSLFTSVLQVLSLSELGFGAAVSYSLYKPISEKNTAKVNAILNLYRRIYIIIGFIILLLAVTLFPFLGHLVAGNVPSGISINVLYFIYVTNTVISYFFFAYKKILLSANQRYDIEVSIASAVLIIQYILQIILLLLFKNYYIYVLVIPFMTFVGNIVAYIIVNKKFYGYKCEGTLSKTEITDIAKLTIGSFFSKVGSTVYLSVDNIVISGFLGLTVLGVYNNYYYVISSLIALFAVIHNTLRPILGNAIVTSEKTKIWKEFNLINTGYMFLVIICCSCCLSLFQDFELVWGGGQNILSIDIVVLLVIYFYIGRFVCPLTLYQEAAGLMWQAKFIPLVAAIVNLMVNIILVRIIGLPGILISSIVSSVCISFPGYFKVIFKCLFNSEKKWVYIRSMTVFTIQCIIVCVCCYLLTYRFEVYTWVSLVIKGIITLLLNIFLILVFNHKNQTISLCSQWVKRKLDNYFSK